MFIGTGTQIGGVREGSGGEQVEGVGIETGGGGENVRQHARLFFCLSHSDWEKFFSPEQDGNLGR